MDQRDRHAFRHVNDAPGAAGSLATEVDYGLGIIRGTAIGFWSVQQVDAHFTALDRCVRALHHRGLTVSVIVDMRASAPAQSQEVSMRLKAGVTGIYRPGDRVAMVLATSLAKMQLRRILDSEYHEFFLSLSAAEKWALAEKR
jgi:hypothetical protein